MQRSFDEVHVYDGVAERTGVSVDRAGVRGHAGVCRSITELATKSRRLGDGYYYVAASAWPDGSTSLTLVQAWVSMA